MRRKMEKDDEYIGSIGFCLILTCSNKKSPTDAGLLLLDQVSNLDSSEPESDVLPVTPSSIEAANVKKYFFLQPIFEKNILSCERLI